MRPWFIVALVVCGCPSPEPELDGGTWPDGGPCPRELVLGTESEAREFVALSDGAELEINAGPQGGWHVWVSVQARATRQSGTLSYVLRSGTQVLSAPLRIELGDAFLEPIACGWERRSDALTFENSGEPWRGQLGEVQMTLESFGTTPSVVKKNVVLR